MNFLTQKEKVSTNIRNIIAALFHQCYLKRFVFEDVYQDDDEYCLYEQDTEI
jgi:hypothetical protein